jgi:predicted O-linked N-acetylglucosamine transferase (SPINDLY family)
MEKAKQHFLDGLAAMQAENWTQAEAAFRQSLTYVPDRVSTRVNLSATLLKLKKQEDAAAVIASILSQDPSNVDALLNEGILFFGQKRFVQALARFDTLKSAHPGNLHVYLNRAMTLDALNRGHEALMDLDHVIRSIPDDALAHACRAGVLCRMEQWRDALSSADRALQLKPDDAQAHFARGNVLFGLKQPEQALQSFEKAISLRADFAEASCHCGRVRGSLLQWQAAIECYGNALSIHPSYVEALVERGRAFEQVGKMAAAHADYARALVIDPECGPAYIEQGNLHRKNKQLELAIAAYEAAHRLDPHTPFLKGKLLHAKMLSCDWTDLSVLRLAIDQGVEAGEKAIDPFAYQAITSSEALLGACARIFSQHWFPPQYRAVSRLRKKQKIHVGYLCGEFREQATSFLMARVYELHNKERFRVVAFDNGFDDGSDFRRRIVSAFDEVVDISVLSDAQAYAEIQKREIDILVNLNGYFGLARPHIFAMRPSPIQVNYLGFPGTIGAPHMDYLLADETVIPVQSQRHYAEQIVYLPQSYQANDDRRAISASRCIRSDFGLPNEGFVFCCFNNNYKITPETFEGWMRLLKRVPGSVLWLFESNLEATKNLRLAAARSGIDGERLVFAQDLPLPEHLARHALADLFLDTLPYNAHTTASDCLWAGLPLLTCTGDSFPGRVASSLLRALDLPELITSSQHQYEEKAVWLANNPGELRALRQKLAGNRLQSPLFNSALKTLHLEQAYSIMLERHHAGLPPGAFSVPAEPAPATLD